MSTLIVIIWAVIGFNWIIWRGFREEFHLDWDEKLYVFLHALFWPISMFVVLIYTLIFKRRGE